MSNFEKGDLVVLNSGGPLMTVRDVDNDTSDGYSVQVRCDWFDKAGQHHTATFNAEMIEKEPRRGTGSPL
ncbi:DUF2158 domain-containing protein [Pseudomonas akapageensis]|uniref:DUF2158 domain-containing protein n=1 Tax=Pseudomonas akapageensis TaxID=2609961 RepID=UPI0014083426|nr:DUF2158 domain-containing protein [Pseudomonas akapageensis]